MVNLDDVRAIDEAIILLFITKESHVTNGFILITED